MALAIIIPARFASTRFPGKPLAMLAGRPMIWHVYARAREAAGNDPDLKIAVATDDARIVSYCESENIPVLMTPADCPSGSDRVIEAADLMGLQANDQVINLQGDAPLTPVIAIRTLLQEFWTHPDTRVATIVKRLTWTELDSLRTAKMTTPFSGTTVLMSQQHKALWFSKTILPTMRDEAALRAQGALSPVLQHIGLYGYQVSTLERFTNLNEGVYEKLEGLEQLRFIENGISIQCVEIALDTLIHSGIDSPEDMARAEQYLNSRGHTL